MQEREIMFMNSIRKVQFKAKGEAQIEVNVQSKSLVAFDNALIIVLVEYSNYSNVFSKENAIKFLEYIKIDDHVIKIEKGKQLLFSSIYSLGLVNLEILKTYFKTNLANNFIRPSKSPAKVLILFDQK